MNELRPAWVPAPKCAAAIATEMATRRAFYARTGVRVLKFGSIYADIIFTLDLKRRVISAEVDRIATTTGSFSADRAIAIIEWVWVRRLQRELNAAAMTRSLQVHRPAPQRSTSSLFDAIDSSILES